MFKLMSTGPYGKGEIILEKCPGSEELNRGWDLGRPHEISFHGADGEKRKLFSCYVSITNNYFIIEDLDYHCGSHIMEEAITYYFLDKVIEKSIDWAIEQKRMSVVVESSLPHITEHFVEHRFSVRTKDLMGSDKGYRGFKTLTK